MNTATQVVKNLIGDSSNPTEEIRNIIKKYGYHINEAHEDDHSIWTIKCPISLLILGAIRLQQQKSTLTEHTLASEGSEFEIKYED